MNEKLNKNAKVELLTKIFLSCEEEKGLIVKDPSEMTVLIARGPSVVSFDFSRYVTSYSFSMVGFYFSRIPVLSECGYNA